MSLNYPSRVTKQHIRNPPTRDVNATQRVALAMKMRAKKDTYDEIAKACGYGSAQAAHKAVMRELERTVCVNVDELRREELDSLERLEVECWKRLEETKFETQKLFAVDRILAVKERRARLMGLDLSNDNAIAAAQIIVQEVPSQYLTGPVPAQEVEA